MWMVVPFFPFSVKPFTPLTPFKPFDIDFPFFCVAKSGVISVRSLYGRTRDCRLNFDNIVRALRDNN